MTIDYAHEHVRMRMSRAALDHPGKVLHLVGRQG